MKKLLPLLGAVLALGFSSCAQQQSVRTNYVAPSTGAVKTSVSGAQSSLTAAKTRSTATNAAIAAAAARAKSVTDRLKVLASSTSGAAHSLVLQVQTDVDLFTKSLLDAKTQNDALVQNVSDAQQSLIAAQTQVSQLQTAVNSQTTELNHTATLLNNEIAAGAKNKAIVAEVNRFMGLGAFWYGFKRLLAYILIFGLVAVTLLVVVGFIAPEILLPILAVIGRALLGFFTLLISIPRRIRGKSLSPILRAPKFPPIWPAGRTGPSGSDFGPTPENASSTDGGTGAQGQTGATGAPPQLTGAQGQTGATGAPPQLTGAQGQTGATGAPPAAATGATGAGPAPETPPYTSPPPVVETGQTSATGP